MLSHRIADPRILRLLGQWLRAGVLKRGEWKEAVEGTPQGGHKPLLANIFLHYVLDLWVHRWRQGASGCVSVVRYANDCASRRREEEVVTQETDSKQFCCTRDEDRPLGPGLKDQGSNHRTPPQAAPAQWSGW